MDLKVTAWRQRVLVAIDEEIEKAERDKMDVKAALAEDLKYRMSRYYDGDGER
jgi:hypothetical protein